MKKNQKQLFITTLLLGIYFVFNFFFAINFLINIYPVCNERFGGFDYNTIKIAVTVCGDETLKQSLVTLKSAVILTKTKIHLIIMSDKSNMRKISQYVSRLYLKQFIFN